jgi:tetratricopeptide (TPR) repeat protein
MDSGKALGVVGLFVMCTFLVPVAVGQEPNFDPWVTGTERPQYMPDRDDEEEEAYGPRGYPGREGLMPSLRRCNMDGLESAQYSVAEMLLQKGDVNGAVAALQEIAAKAKGEDVRDTTYYNLGEIYRRRLNDMESAAKNYRQVTGSLRHRASKQLLNMLADAGKVDDAGKATDELVARAKEKGEKLALLHRLAIVYKRHKMPDKALAVYQRITKEFTPEEMKQIIAATELEVKTTFRKMRNLQREGGGQEMMRLQEQMQRRPQELRAAGRWDEFNAYQKALQRGWQRGGPEGDEEEAAQPEEKAAPGGKKKEEF